MVKTPPSVISRERREAGRDDAFRGELLSFPLDTKDVVYSLETMERKVKEFERYTSIDIPEFLQVGIVNLQTEGPMRTCLIMNARRLVLGHQWRSDECQASSKCGDDEGRRCDGCGSVLEECAQRSFQQLWKGEELRGHFFWFCGEKKATERPSATRDKKGSGKGKSKGLKKGDGKGARKCKKAFKGKCFK